MADGVPASRCGPICQHPGCWHTSTQDGYVQHKDTGCAQFLSELLLRRKELKRLQTRDGECALFRHVLLIASVEFSSLASQPRV